MQEHFYVFANQEQLGPFNKDEIVSLFQEGRLDENSAVYDEETQDWISILQAPTFQTLQLERLQSVSDEPTANEPHPTVAMPLCPTEAGIYVIEVVDQEGNVLSAEQTLEVTAADPVRLEIEVDRNHVYTDEFIKVQVRAYDQYGNWANHFSSRFSITLSGSAHSFSSIEMAGGYAEFSVTDISAEKVDILVSCVQEQWSQLQVQTSVQFALPEPAALRAEGPLAVIAGQPAHYQVQALDQSGNIIRGWTGNAHIRIRASEVNSDSTEFESQSSQSSVSDALA